MMKIKEGCRNSWNSAVEETGKDTVRSTISVVIPAHNEQAVIERTLRTLLDGAGKDELDVVVVCNGCTDETANLCRQSGYPVRVIETEIAGKCHALNLGEMVARGFPRVYMDADVSLSMQALRQLGDRLESGNILCAAPQPCVELGECSWAVRAYYRVWSMLPSGKDGIGGSGVYALSKEGRGRFGLFPPITADDTFVRIQFDPDERETVAGAYSIVYPPRSLKSLIKAKTRSRYGALELSTLFPEKWKRVGGVRKSSHLKLMLRPWIWHLLAVYWSVILICKKRSRALSKNGSQGWIRDESSRIAAKSVIS